MSMFWIAGACALLFIALGFGWIKLPQWIEGPLVGALIIVFIASFWLGVVGVSWADVSSFFASTH